MSAAVVAVDRERMLNIVSLTGRRRGRNVEEEDNGECNPCHVFMIFLELHRRVG